VLDFVCLTTQFNETALQFHTGVKFEPVLKVDKSDWEGPQAAMEIRAKGMSSRRIHGYWNLQ